MSAVVEYIGSGLAAAALFQQTGGTNTAGLVSIAPGGYYRLSGGAIQVSGGFANAGVLDGGNAPAVINIAANSLVDLSGSIVNCGSTSITIGANSLVIVPSGSFNPARL